MANFVLFRGEILHKDAHDYEQSTDLVEFPLIRASTKQVGRGFERLENFLKAREDSFLSKPLTEVLASLSACRDSIATRSGFNDPASFDLIWMPVTPQLLEQGFYFLVQDPIGDIWDPDPSISSPNSCPFEASDEELLDWSAYLPADLQPLAHYRRERSHPSWATHPLITDFFHEAAQNRIQFLKPSPFLRENEPPSYIKVPKRKVAYEQFFLDASIPSSAFAPHYNVDEFYSQHSISHDQDNKLWFNLYTTSPSSFALHIELFEAANRHTLNIFKREFNLTHNGTYVHIRSASYMNHIDDLFFGGNHSFTKLTPNAMLIPHKASANDFALWLDLGRFQDRYFESLVQGDLRKTMEILFYRMTQFPHPK